MTHYFEIQPRQCRFWLLCVFCSGILSFQYAVSSAEQPTSDAAVQKITEPPKPVVATALAKVPIQTARQMVKQFLVIHFYSSLVREEKDSDFMESRVAQPFMQRFCANALTLKEFRGTRDESEITWTPLEKQMLTMLRTAVQSNPFFTMTQIDLSLRGVALDGHWAPEKAIRLNLPEDLEVALAAMDDEVYKQTAQAFRKWALDSCAQQPAWKLQRSEELRRMAWLLSNIANHANFGNGNTSIPQKRAWAVAKDKIQRELQAKWEELNTEQIPKEIFSSDSLTGKFWAYYQQAIKTNPCFKDLSISLGEGEFLRMYMEYTKKNEATDERDALDHLLKMVWVNMNDKEPDAK